MPFLISFLAALAAGFVNSLAGGGTLITFPALTALGMPMVNANVTNNVALSPGLLSGVYAQRRDFSAQKLLLYKLIPLAIVGGILGGLLLLFTPDGVFRIAVPFLISLATLLMIFQNKIKLVIVKINSGVQKSESISLFFYIFIFLAAIYGGYFGAGLGIILMAVFGLFLHENTNKLNVLKQAISFCVNISAAIFFCFSGKVNWNIALVMIVGSVAGGYIGGKFSAKIKSSLLRTIIICIGVIISIYYFISL